MEARKLLAFGLVAIIILLFIAGYGIASSVEAKLHYAVSGALMVTLYDPNGKPINLPSPNSILPLDFMYQGKKVAYVGAKVRVDAVAKQVALSMAGQTVHYKVVLHIQRYWIPPSSSPTPRPLGEKTLSKEGTANVTKGGKISIGVAFGMIPLDQLLPTDKPDGSQFKLAITAEVIISAGASNAKATSDEVDIYLAYSSGATSTTSATTTTAVGGGGGGKPPIRMFEIVRVAVTPTTT